MKVLDLFCGLNGWSQAFEDRGHEVVTVDMDPKFQPTIPRDVMDLTKEDFEQWYPFDIILASPPCNCFSVASVYRHWDKDTKRPKDQATYDSIDLVAHTIKLILNLHPRWWILENPRGMLRNVLGFPTATITQCQYGRNVMKPTDFWGNLPKKFKAKRCKNKAKCHISASRGSQFGTQGYLGAIGQECGFDFKKASEIRAKIPYGLSKAVCLACEKELEVFTG